MGTCDPQQVQNLRQKSGCGSGDKFVSGKGWTPKSALPSCFLQFPSPLIGSASLISWCLCRAVMRAGLNLSILGQWLCAGDLGSGRGREGSQSWTLASKKKRGACLKLALPAPMGGKAACTHGGGKGCLRPSRGCASCVCKVSQGPRCALPPRTCSMPARRLTAHLRCALLRG